jgi:L-lysine 2,3-aminomutase
MLTISQFIAARGNEYFCEIDEDYLTDRFNLTGLNTEVQYYQYALDLVTDVFDMEVDDDMREQIEKSARHLYGLVHARYVVTTRGLAKMVRAPHSEQHLDSSQHTTNMNPQHRWKSSSKASSANARA